MSHHHQERLSVFDVWSRGWGKPELRQLAAVLQMNRLLEEERFYLPEGLIFTKWFVPAEEENLFNDLIFLNLGSL